MKTFVKLLVMAICGISFAQTNLSLRVNAGGPELTHGGETFLADQYYVGGSTWSGGGGAPIGAIYKTERSADPPTFSYSIPVDNGSYRITLHFAEIYWNAVDKRIFDVSIEGNLVLDNYDIYADVGHDVETTKVYDVTVSDGNLDIYFSALTADGGANQPKLSALEVAGLASADTQAPTAPTLSSTGKTDTTVDLSWSGATDNTAVTGYKVFKDAVLEATLGAVTTYQVTGLTASTAYQFTVTALDAAANESVASNALSVTTNSAPDTQAPTAPTLSSTGKADTTVDLSWSGATDNTAVTGYKIFKDAVLEATLGAVTTYQVTGLTASTAYQFTVTALDAATNESVASNALSVTTNAASGGGSGNWTLNGSDLNYTAGNVAIGTSTIPTDYKLAVDGKIISEEIKVQLQSQWPDYVFDDDYNLPTLQEIQKHIEEYGHLPNIPSAAEVKSNGIELGEMNRLLLEKIEELTLYLIEEKAKNTMQENKIDLLLRRLIKLEENNETKY